MLIEKSHLLIDHYEFISGNGTYTYRVIYIRYGTNKTRRVQVKIIDNRPIIPTGCYASVEFSYLTYKFCVPQLLRKAGKYFNNQGLTYHYDDVL